MNCVHVTTTVPSPPVTEGSNHLRSSDPLKLSEQRSPAWCEASDERDLPGEGHNGGGARLQARPYRAREGRPELGVVLAARPPAAPPPRPSLSPCLPLSPRRPLDRHPRSRPARAQHLPCGRSLPRGPAGRGRRGGGGSAFLGRSAFPDRREGCLRAATAPPHAREGQGRARQGRDQPGGAGQSRPCSEAGHRPRLLRPGSSPRSSLPAPASFPRCHRHEARAARVFPSASAPQQKNTLTRFNILFLGEVLWI